MAYGFGVFLLPLSRVVGIGAPVSCPRMGLWDALFTTACDWRIRDLDWIYTLFFVFLGTSAAVWGGWLERVGPRKAGAVAAACWSGGTLAGALGIAAHQLWLLWLGCGVVGGVGLGLGYISPISTLMRWFPDRRGLAAGLAVMGFGGGAMIGAPLADRLMAAFGGPASVGAWQTFVVLAAIYGLAMGAGALGFRTPPPGWRLPHGPAAPARPGPADAGVHFNAALGIPQFWLLWTVLCLNVTAGIGVLGMAPLMLQEVFGGLLLRLPGRAFADLDSTEKAAAATVAAGFIGLLSLFNIAGRIAWPLLSDRIGRRNTFSCLLLLGVLCYASVPGAAQARNVPAFVVLLCLIVSMFGGAFATMPAYVADIFGTRFASAIQGRILTAWATAGVLGPLLIGSFREGELAAGRPAASAYDATMHILAALIALGFVANLMVRPLGPCRRAAENLPASTTMSIPSLAALCDSGIRRNLNSQGATVKLVAAWLSVGLPLAWGTWMTLAKTLVLLGAEAW